MDYPYRPQVFTSVVADMLTWLRGDSLPFSGDDIARLKAGHRA